MHEDIQYWEDSAEEWSELLEKDRLRHRNYREVLSSDALVKLSGDVRGKQILVAGSGEGVFAQLFTRNGAKVLGVDGSKKMVKLASQKYPEIEFRLMNLTEKQDFAAASFDFIIASMLFMSLEKIDTFLSESKRILRKNGKLIFSVLHPAFNYPTMKLHKKIMDKILFREPSGLAFDYFSKERKIRREDNTQIRIPFYHRTLEDYSQELKNAGFVIEEILEPHELPRQFLKNQPRLEYVTRLPRFLFVKASAFKHEV